MKLPPLRSSFPVLTGQGPNAVHNRPFGLDASVLMDDALRLDKPLIHEWSFDLDKGEIAIVGKAKKSSRAGTIHLFLNWPNTDQNLPTGFVTVSHPSWKTLPRYVLLTGIPNKDGGFLWRFLCPITRKLSQVVCFDEKSQLFVSRAALGRGQRKSDFSESSDF